MSVLRSYVLFFPSDKVWAALGTAIVSIAGIVLFGERFDSAKIICLAMIVLGVVGLELSEGH